MAWTKESDMAGPGQPVVIAEPRHAGLHLCRRQHMARGGHGQMAALARHAPQERQHVAQAGIACRAAGGLAEASVRTVMGRPAGRFREGRSGYVASAFWVLFLFPAGSYGCQPWTRTPSQCFGETGKALWWES